MSTFQRMGELLELSIRVDMAAGAKRAAERADGVEKPKPVGEEAVLHSDSKNINTARTETLTLSPPPRHQACLT